MHFLPQKDSEKISFKICSECGMGKKKTGQISAQMGLILCLFHLLLLIAIPVSLGFLFLSYSE